MRVEIEAEKVNETFDSVTKEFQHEAVLPGFRPGKAPHAGREIRVRGSTRYQLAEQRYHCVEPQPIEG